VGDGGLGCRAMGGGWGLAEVSERRRHASWGFRVLGGGWLRGAEFGLVAEESVEALVLALGNGEVSWSANRSYTSAGPPCTNLSAALGDGHACLSGSYSISFKFKLIVIVTFYSKLQKLRLA
jgi:hypothetical protein